jgi:hypothetical protein
VTVADAHQPGRPSWDCTGCGRPWPCDPVREELVSTMDAVQVAVYAGTQLEEAVRDLPATAPGELFDRFLAWTRRPA